MHCQQSRRKRLVVHTGKMVTRLFAREISAESLFCCSEDPRAIRYGGKKTVCKISWNPLAGKEKNLRILFSRRSFYGLLWSGLLSITWQQVVMYVVGLLLIYLAIEKNYEPALLLPMGFGAILVNLPASGVLNQFMEGAGETHGIIQWLFESGIEASEAFPLLLFIGIGAMIDFGPLLSNPKMFLFGAASQFGIFLRSLWHHFSALISRTLPLSESSERRMVRLRSWYLRC